jgi:hypothetical protein
MASSQTPNIQRVVESLTVENPIDRMIRLTAIAVGVVSLLVYLVFHFI